MVDVLPSDMSEAKPPVTNENAATELYEPVWNTLDELTLVWV